MQNQQQPNIDLSTTTQINTPTDGVIFKQGLILRKVSKFLAGTDEDALIPIPVIYDPVSKKILPDSLPKELREELTDHLINE